MNSGGRRKLLIIISGFAALALTSTAMGQVIIDNTYNLQVSQFTPPVHLTAGNQSYSSLTVTTNGAGSVAYANLSEVFFYASSQTTKNLSNILFLTSNTPGSFYYTINVVNFTGYGHTSSVNLYSTNSTGAYFDNFYYSSANGNVSGNSPANVNPHTVTGIGLNVSVGKTIGSYTWELDLEINGYFTSNNSSKVVFTQYYVNFLVTTTEEA